MEAARSSAPAVTLGPVIHNPQVVEELQALGVTPVESLDQVAPGSRVVIRAHGVGRRVLEALKDKGCEIIDATCPFVKRIHAIAQNAPAR